MHMHPLFLSLFHYVSLVFAPYILDVSILGARGVQQASHNIYFLLQVRFNVFSYFLQLKVFNTVCRGARAFIDAPHSFAPFFSSLSLYSI